MKKVTKLFLTVLSVFLLTGGIFVPTTQVEAADCWNISVPNAGSGNHCRELGVFISGANRNRATTSSNNARPTATAANALYSSTLEGNVPGTAIATSTRTATGNTTRYNLRAR